MSSDHPLRFTAVEARVRVVWRGRVVADSERAVALKEHVYPEVIYVPRDDADMSVFERTAHETICPYKGVANYYSLKAPDAVDVNAVWTYETPLEGTAAIGGHLAFYPDKVVITREEV